MGSHNLLFQAFYVNDDAPLALRAIQGHSVIEATPTLMEWRKITASEAPRLYYGTRFCNINSVLKHGILPCKTTHSGHSGIVFSAVLTSGANRSSWAGCDDRDEWGLRENGNDSDENVKTSLEGISVTSELP